MKNNKIICFILLCVFSSILCAQEVGEKVYKKVESNGRIVEKWVLYYSYTEYDVNGNVIHEKETYGGDTSYEYNEKGQLIHQKGPFNNEYWYKYDGYGNKIWEKNSSKEISYELKYNTNGKKIYEKSSEGIEIWYEYDDDGNMIHKMKTGGNDYKYKYDKAGRCIYENENGKITWYEYSEDGKLLKMDSNYGWKKNNSYTTYGKKHWITSHIKSPTESYDNETEVDDNGNPLHVETGYGSRTEYWYEYEFYEDGTVKSKKEFNTYIN